jgi:lipopolysaccharide export system protein LptA
VVRQQGRGEFHGDKLTYNTNTALITGEASGDGLVHGVIVPKTKPGAPAAPTAKPVPAPPATTPTKPATQPTGNP